jgi:hypothetical protein
MSETVNRHLARAAARAEADPFFVASALAAYRALLGMGEARLAAWLGCSVENLARLALCRRPDGESAMFGEEVRRIAAYVDGDASRLANLLRTVESAKAMDGTASATLMAAQDRVDEQTDAQRPRSEARESAASALGSEDGLDASARDHATDGPASSTSDAPDSPPEASP